MVACHQENIGFQRANLWNDVVQSFNHFHLAGEVAILARRVGVLEMEEEKVVVVPSLGQGLDLIIEGRSGVADVHTHQPGKASVHGIDGKGKSIETIDVFEGGNRWVFGEAPQGRHVDPLFPRQQFRHLS